MTRHDEHLPERRHKNKAVSPYDPFTRTVAPAKDVSRVATQQGEGTKKDAKNAKQRRR